VRPYAAVKGGAPYRARYFEAVLAVVFMFLLATPLKEAPSIVTIRASRAQELIGQLSAALSIRNQVEVAVVIQHPLVFSVEPLDSGKNRFRLSMELGFLLMLDDNELCAALAHELGHVWIFKHHPFLQTERLANSIGERVVKRAYFERVYSKMWAYEGTSGVPIGQLLGPDRDADRQPEQNPQ
jgi:hypothetical protein